MVKKMSKLIEKVNEELEKLKLFKECLTSTGKEFITEYMTAWKAINSQERDKLNNNEEYELSYYFPVCIIKNKYDNTNIQWLIKKNPKFAVKSLKDDRFKYKISDTLKDRFSYSQKYFTKANSWDHYLIKNFEIKVAPIRKALSKLQKLIVALEQIKSDESAKLGIKFYSFELSHNSSYKFLDKVIPYLFNSRSFVSFLDRYLDSYNQQMSIKIAKEFLPYDILVKTDFSAGEGTINIIVPEEFLQKLGTHITAGSTDDFFNLFINRELEEEIEDIYHGHRVSYFDKSLPEVVYQNLGMKFPELKGELFDE
jgi:hypothetical protein